MLPQAQLSGKVGENTWNSRLANLLKSRGFDSAEFELLYQTFKGLRKPDVPFQSNKGLCLLSGKLGSSKEIEAISSAQDYKEDFRNVTQVAEVFGLTYPATGENEFHLHVLPNELHKSLSWMLANLDEVADKISEVVSQKYSGMEPTEMAAIRVLRTGVVELSVSLGTIPAEEFENLFGGRNFFESSLGYAETKTEKARILRTAAAYLFVNQVLFYQVLSKETPNDTYPVISDENASHPERLRDAYFKKVTDVDYHAVFDFDVSSKLRSPESRDASRKIVKAIQIIFTGKMEHDIIGKVFHQLIPRETRKVVAAYYTNSAAGDLLARLSIKAPDEIVLDPACGSGTLLVSAYKSKGRVSGKPVTERQHKRFVEHDLTGIDIMPFSAHLAAINLALQAPLYETNNVQIAIDDSTQYAPGDIIDSVRQTFKEAFTTRRITDYLEESPKVTHYHRETSQRGVIKLGTGTNKIQLQSVDEVIMNPPFTSCDNLPSEYKDTLKERFSEPKAYAACLTGKLSLQAYFILLADRFLKETGRLACVIPMTTLIAKAFNNLTDFLVSNYSIKYIVVGLGRSAFSENTALSEILFVAEKRKPTPDNKFVLVGTKLPPTKWTEDDVESIELQARETSRKGIDAETDLAITQAIPQTELSRRGTGLNELVLKFDKGFNSVLTRVHKLYQDNHLIVDARNLEPDLGCEFFAYELRIKGGAYYGLSALSISGSQDRAKKRSDILVYQGQTGTEILATNRFTKETVRIPRNSVVKQVRRLSGVTTMDLTSDTEYLVSRPFPGIENLLRKAYPESQARVFESRLRRDWTEKVRHGLSNIVLARRIDLSAPGTCVIASCSSDPFFLSANTWGIRGLSEDDARILTMWFNSSLFVLEILSKRTQTRGSWGQIDKNFLFQMKSVDPSHMSPPQKKRVLDVSRHTRPDSASLLKQFQSSTPNRVEIDTAFLELLGVPEESRPKLVQEIHEAVYNKLTSFKETMEED